MAVGSTDNNQIVRSCPVGENYSDLRRNTMLEVLQDRFMCTENFFTSTYTCTCKDSLLVGVVAVVLFPFFQRDTPSSSTSVPFDFSPNINTRLEANG